MTAPKSTRARPARAPVGVVPHAGKPTHAETTGHVPASVDFSGLPDSQTRVDSGEPEGEIGVDMPATLPPRDDEPTRPSIPTTRPPAGPQRGDRVMYTNRLGVGPWPGIVEDAHVDIGGAPGCWLRVTKPNGNEFFTAAVMGDGPDQFTLAD